MPRKPIFLALALLKKVVTNIISTNPLALSHLHMNSELNSGWTILFEKNVHMYCHNLIVSKGDLQYQVPCEDSPQSDVGVLMWLYEINLEKTIFKDLVTGLTQWANSSGMKYRLYLTKDEYRSA